MSLLVRRGGQWRFRKDDAVFAEGALPGSGALNIALGTYFEYNNQQVFINGFEQWLGRPLEYLLIFTDYNVQPGQTADPYDHLALPGYLRAQHENNPHLGVWLGSSMVMRKNGAPNYDREMSWTQLANGALDQTWITQAKRLQALNNATRPAPRVRGPHELDLGQWHYSPYQGNATDIAAYKSAAQRYYNIMHQHCPNVIVEFNPVTSAGLGGNNHAFATIVPASTAFDCLAIDTYDIDYNNYGWVPGVNAPPTDAQNQALAAKALGDATTGRGLNYLRAQAVALGKPISFPETGNGGYLFKNGNQNVSGGDNPFFWHMLADFIADPAYPAGTGGPGCVDALALWEDGPTSQSNGLCPRTYWGLATADTNRTLNWGAGTYPFPQPRSRAAFEQRFIG